ncbi:MAG: hypothetical protein AAGA87_06645 [Pseudomonadota bacterium]
MTDDPKKRMDSVRQEIDLRLDGLFGDLGRALGDVLAKLDEAGGEVRHARSFDTGDGPIRAQADIRFRMGGLEGGASTATPEPVKPESPKPRDITATILSEGPHWSLTAELPGVTEADLDLTVTDGQITITAAGQGRAYTGTFDAPATLTKDSLTVSLRNGILDLSAEVPE